MQTPKKKKAKVIKQSAHKAANFKRNPNNKFGKRFNMGGSGLTNATESFKQVQSANTPQTEKKAKDQETRLGTPSTNTSNSVSVSESQISSSNVVETPPAIRPEYETSLEDQNQWIRYPTLLTDIINNQEIEDPIAVLKQKKATETISILNDYLNMWARTVEELLERMRETIPAEGMIGEVHYWRDLSKVLDGISAELKQPGVEMTVQILLSKSSESANATNALATDVTNFTKLKSRVMKGAKEARWNNKYMRIIEKPVKQIEQADKNLMDIQIVIVALLKSLKNIYDTSNFYKEARIVSFVDRLLECIKGKLKRKFGLS